MARDFGFKVARRRVDVTTTNAQQIAFSSAFPLDKVLVRAIGVNKPHGQNYKPTLLAFNQDGSTVTSLGITYIDNYQIVIGASTRKGIALFQQGS